MKQFYCVAIILFTLSASAQEMRDTDVPAEVKAAVQKSYKDAKGLKWEKEGPNFEAEFVWEGKETSAVYDQNGTFLEVEIEFKLADIPAAARDYLSKNYTSKKINEVTKISKADGSITYEIEIKKKDLFFDANGQFIKEVVERTKD